MNSYPRCAVLILIPILFSCGGNLRNPPTRADAGENLRRRIVDSQEVRSVIHRMEQALEPVDRVINDFRTTTDPILDRSDAKAMLNRLALSKLREILRDLERGLMVKRVDGEREWSAKRNVKWPFERVRADGQICGTSEVEVRGLETDAKEFELTVSISDCANAPRELLFASGRKDSDLHVKLSASAFGEVVSPEILTEHCRIMIDREDHSQIQCEPMTFKSDQGSIMVQSLTGHRHGKDAEASLIAEVHGRHTFVGTAHADWKSGSKPNVKWIKPEAPPARNAPNATPGPAATEAPVSVSAPAEAPEASPAPSSPPAATSEEDHALEAT